MISKIFFDWGKPQKPKDPNSSCKKRMLEKRINKLLTYGQSEKVKKQLYELRIKLFSEVNRIQKRNDKI